MQRDQEAQRSRNRDTEPQDLDGGVSDAPRVSFSSSGALPPVGGHPLVPTVTASEQAYIGPGLEAVQKLRDPSPAQIAAIIEKHPSERDRILHYVREKYGGDWSLDVAHDLQRRVDKSKGPQPELPGVKVGDYKLQLLPALKTKDASAKATDDTKLETERQAQNKGDKPYSPMSEELDRKLHGAKPKPIDQQRIEDSLTQSIDGGVERKQKQ
jgi:hypothetical protein